MGFELYNKDPKSGERSVTLTLLIAGFIVCMVKLLLSDLVIDGFVIPHFSGLDCATVLGALGALYGYRQYTGARYKDKVDARQGEIDLANVNKKIDIEKEEEQN